MEHSYFEEMNDKEVAYIQKILNRESTGYYKTLRMMAIICFFIILIVGLLTIFLQPQEGERVPSLSSFLLTTGLFFLFIFTLVIYGKKKISSHYKKDIRERRKIIVPMRILKKQHIPLHQSFHFHLHDRKLSSIQVSREDYMRFEAGDIINIEFANSSKTYLGYF